jgi:hypothetical protein
LQYCEDHNRVLPLRTTSTHSERRVLGGALLPQHRLSCLLLRQRLKLNVGAGTPAWTRPRPLYCRDLLHGLGIPVPESLLSQITGKWRKPGKL